MGRTNESTNKAPEMKSTATPEQNTTGGGSGDGPSPFRYDQRILGGGGGDSPTPFRVGFPKRQAVAPAELEQLQVERTFTSTNSYGEVYYSKEVSVFSRLETESPVLIHYRDGTTWKDVAMERVLSGAGFSIWALRQQQSASLTSTLPVETDFAIAQSVGDHLVWENNGSRNYHLGECDGASLGRNVNVRLYLASLSPSTGSGSTRTNTLSGSIIVRNLGFPKDVQLFYRVASGEPSTCSAKFEPELQVGYRDFVRSPNSNECEMFGFNVSVGKATEVTFSLTYSVNGHAYVDDNWGQEYSCKLNS